MEETHSNRQRYEWQIKGWSRCNKNLNHILVSRCSRECGGGTRHLVTRCYHPVTGQVRRRHLAENHLHQRGSGIGCVAQREVVQEEERRSVATHSGLDFKTWQAPLYPQFLHSCDMEWVAGDWEPCTTSCGKNGTRQREVKSTISRTYLMFCKGLLSSPGRPKDRPALVEHARHPPLRSSYQTSR